MMGRRRREAGHSPRTMGLNPEFGKKERSEWGLPCRAISAPTRFPRRHVSSIIKDGVVSPIECDNVL
jgi:hypothetical protein